MADFNAVAQLGSKLASNLGIHSEGCHQSRRRLPQLVSVLNSTSSTIGKLDGLIQQNENVFTKQCIEDIDAITAKCKAIYVGILILVSKKTQSVSGDKDTVELSTEQIDNLMSSLANMSIWRTEAWQWLRPRLEICEQELTQLKFELVLRFLLGSIAQHQMQTMVREPGAWENENSLRCFAENVSGRRVANYRHYTRQRNAWKEEAKPLSPKSSFDDIYPVYTDGISPTPRPRPPPGYPYGPGVPPPLGPYDAPTPGAYNAPTPGPYTVPPPLPPVPRYPYFESNDEKLKDEPKTEPVKVPEKSSSDAVEKNQVPARTTKSWFQRLFSRGTQEDWGDQKIVAFIADLSSVSGTTGQTQIQAEDHEIKATLSKLTSGHRWRRTPNLVDQHASLEQNVRKDIEDAIMCVRKMSSRDLTLVWMDIKKSQAQLAATKATKFHYSPDLTVTLFFKEGDELEPIYIDTPDKKLELPYNSCLTHELLKKMLLELDWRLGCAPQRYDLFTESGLLVVRETWDAIRRPGLKLNLKLRVPGPVSIPPIPHMQPPRHLPPPPPPPIPYVSPYDKAREERKEAYHEMVQLFGPAYSWSPDEETVKPRLHNLLRLWTNAIDPHTEDCSDVGSVDTYWYSSESDY
ncbi:hypothetical protein F53441_10805 [Fusarium austroafricanum]|uniref:Fungal N-terminal domain-containing protein n=1 Tax=Fusarium austroafricanum TaxID=2364996 RepID=A0A8H4K9P3_9HYPO|nr:hypothetical protein F53441_10805 [Fusarium austroafricanum]